jgi:hypothetical protein
LDRGYARALWATSPEPLLLTGKYTQATRYIRKRDGSTTPVRVDVHPDMRVQRVLELFRERESEQAIDRLRLIFNTERKTIYLASNLPLPDLVVDRTVTQPELIHEIAGRIDNGRTGTGRRTYANRLAEAWRRSGGALPLAHRELFRLYGGGPDGLWPSEWAVQNDVAPLSRPPWRKGGANMCRPRKWVFLGSPHIFPAPSSGSAGPDRRSLPRPSSACLWRSAAPP